MQKIGPCLWFDRQAGDAAEFYVAIFPDSRILDINYYAEGMPLPAGTVLTVRFVLDGEEFVALNGGPMFSFTPAVSFIAHCDTQAEVDQYWQRLSDGGQPGQCGWLTDRWGVSWQVVPRMLGQVLGGADAAASQRAMAAMLRMQKLDIAALQAAYAGT